MRFLQSPRDTTVCGTQPPPLLDTTSPPSGTSQQQQPERTLLIGDDNFLQIRTSDLDEKCSIRTIRDANIDLIRCWIHEKLTWIPRSCILYCGYQDMCEGNIIEETFDRLGSLIACLKQFNENMDIYICELVPSVKKPNLRRQSQQL